MIPFSLAPQNGIELGKTMREDSCDRNEEGSGKYSILTTLNLRQCLFNATVRQTFGYMNIDLRKSVQGWY